MFMKELKIFYYIELVILLMYAFLKSTNKHLKKKRALHTLLSRDLIADT